MTTTPAMLTVEPLYEGSDIAILGAALQELCPDVPLFVGAGEASRHRGPPVAVFVGPLDESYRPPQQQPTDGRASLEAVEEYELELWGRSLDEARAIREQVLGALVEQLGTEWNLEVGRGRNDGGKQGERSWVKTITLRVVFPIYSVRYQRAHLDDGRLHGVLVGQLVPPDPHAEPIPGLE